MTLKIKKQSLFDQRCILTSFIFTDSVNKINLSKKIIQLFRQKFSIIEIRQYNEPVKQIYFNFKKEHSLFGQEWYSFQLYRKPLIFIYVAHVLSELALSIIIENYISAKLKYSNISIVNKLLLIYDDDLTEKVDEIRSELSKENELDKESCLSDENDVIFSESNEAIPEVKLIKESFLEDEVTWLSKSYIESEVNQPLKPASNSPTSKYTKFNKDPLNSNSMSSISTDHSNTSMLNTENVSNYDCLTVQIDPMFKFVHSYLDKQLNTLQVNLQQQIVSGSNFSANESEKGSVMSLASEDMVLDPIEEDKQLTSSITTSNTTSTTSSTNATITATSSASRLLDEIRAASQGGAMYQQQQIQLQQYARRWKQAGDLALLLSQPERAYHLYKTAISFRVIQKKPLWMAGAQEGMCAAWVIAIYRSANQAFSDTNLNRLLSYTLDNYPITPIIPLINSNNNSQLPVSSNISSPVTGAPLNSPSDSSSLSTSNISTGNNLVITSSRKKVPDILNLAELTEKFIDIINKYKKILKSANATQTASSASVTPKRYHPIHFDVCVKAGQFFVQQNLYLEAINMFKLIKGDMLDADKEMESYHNLMSNYYSTMGFKRKASLHKYQRYLLYQQQYRQNPQHMTITEMTQIEYLLSIISDLGLNIDELQDQISYTSTFTFLPIYNHNTNDFVGFSSIKLKILYEIINKINNNNNNNKDDDGSINNNCNYNKSVLILSLLITLLELYGDSSALTVKEVHSLFAISNDLYTKSSNQLSQLTAACNVSVTQLPSINSMKPVKLSDSLLPHCDKEVSVKNEEISSVFIYTPLLKGLNKTGSSQKEELVEWVVGEDCEIILQLYNPLPIPLELKSFEVLLTEQDPQKDIDEKLDLWVSNEGYSSVQKLEPRQITTLTLIIIPTTVSYTSLYKITKLRYKIPAIHPTLLFYNTIPSHIFNYYPIKMFPPLPLVRILTSLPSQRSFSLLPGEMHQFKLYLSNESHNQQITTISSSIEEYDYVTVQDYEDAASSKIELKLRSSMLQKIILFNRQQVTNSLPLFSLSSLKMPRSPVNGDKSVNSDDNSQGDDVDSLSTNQPQLPTEAVLTMKADTQNEELCNELFKRANRTKYDNDSATLWQGKFVIKFEYSNMKREQPLVSSNSTDDQQTNNGSDIDDIVYVTNSDANDDEGEEIIGSELISGFYYRLCTLNIDCNIEYGLVITDYRVDSDLNIIIEITNLSMKYKFKLEVYWCKKRILTRPISLSTRPQLISSLSQQQTHLAPQPSTTSMSNYPQHMNRSISTDSNSASTCHTVTIPSDLLDLKRLSSISQLTDYVKEKLRLTWIAMENADNHVAQAHRGKVNINYCHCALSNSLSVPVSPRSSTIRSIGSNTSGLYSKIVCHPLMFRLEDLFRIWIHDNLYIDMSFEMSNINSDKPVSLVEDVNKMNVFDSVHFIINLKFKDSNAAFLTNDLVQCINVFPDVIMSGIDIVNSVDTNSDTVSILHVQSISPHDSIENGSREEKQENGSDHHIDPVLVDDNVTIDSAGSIGSTSRPFIISGHTSLGLTNSILSSGNCQLKGLITFLVTGYFNVCGMVTVRLPSPTSTINDSESLSHNNQHNWHRNNRQNPITLASSRITQFIVSSA